jgi:hypothetical protein
LRNFRDKESMMSKYELIIFKLLAFTCDNQKSFFEKVKNSDKFRTSSIKLGEFYNLFIGKFRNGFSVLGEFYGKQVLLNEQLKDILVRLDRDDMRVMNINSVIWNHQELLEEIYLKIFIYSRLSMVLEKQLGQDQGMVPGLRGQKDKFHRSAQTIGLPRSSKNIVKFMPTKKSSFSTGIRGIKSEFKAKTNILQEIPSDLSNDKSEESETSEGKAKAKAKIGKPKNPIAEGRLEILNEVDNDSGSGSGSSQSDTDKTSSESGSDAFEGGKKDTGSDDPEIERGLKRLASSGFLTRMDSLPKRTSSGFLNRMDSLPKRR